MNKCKKFVLSASAQYGLGEEPVCLLTALKSGGDVTQMCFNPNQPESLTLKKNNDVSLTFDSNDPRPVSIVIKRPKEIGLDVDQVLLLSPLLQLSAIIR